MAISVPPKGEAEKKIGAQFAPLSTSAQDTPNMTVQIRAGWFYNTGGVAVEFVGGNSPVIAPPASNAKWVIVGLTDTASVTLVQGVAATSPQLPEIPDGVMPLAFVYVVSTATSLTNERIYDARPLFQSTNSVPNLQTELNDRPTFTDLNNGLALKADVDGTPNYDFYLNKGDGPQTDAKLIVKRGAAADVAIRWNETLDVWEITNDGATYNAIGTVAGTFMPRVPAAVNGNVATFTAGDVVDSGTALTDLATDVDVATALALKADVTSLTTHTSNATIHFTLPIAEGDVTNLTTDLAAKVDDTGDTMTGDLTVQVGANQAITLSSRDSGSSGLLIDRSGVPGPDAILEFDESTDQWLAGTIGSAFPILTAENLALVDLTDVEDTMTPVANDVLRFVGGEWTNDAMADKVNLAGDTMTGALVLAAGVSGAPALSFTSDVTKGMYDSGAGEISFAIGGAQKVLIDSTGLTTFSGYATGTTGMALWNTGSPTTGVSFPSPGVMVIVVAGVPVATFGGAPGPTSGLVAGDIGTTVQAWHANLDALSDPDITYTSATNGNDGQFFVNTTTGIGSQGSVVTTQNPPARVAIYGVKLDNGTSGTAGRVDIWGGYGTSGSGTVNGGDVNIWGGFGGGPNTRGGNLNLFGGDGVNQDGITNGAVNITGGNPNGNVNITGGTDTSPGTAVGGDILLTSGAGGTTSGAGGAIAIVGGGATTEGDGGDVVITGGAAIAIGATQTGGDVILTGGAGNGSSSVVGGAVILTGGTANASGAPGGSVQLLGGSNSVSGGGGSVAITAASGTTSGNGGNVTITAGALAGAGAPGSINLVIPATGTLRVNGAAGSSGQILTSGGAAVAPTWQSVNTALGYTAADASTLSTHTGDATIHFTQAAISITASQVSDFSTAADARISNAVGVTVQAYDATYLVDADIGVNVQAYDATIVVDADIGVSVQAELGYTPADIAGDTFTSDVTVQGTIIGYKDNATSARVSGPQDASEGGADVQSYSGIFHNVGYDTIGTLKTRFITGGNLEMDVVLISPHQLQLVAADNTQSDGQIYLASKTDIVFNMRAEAEDSAGAQLVFDRVSTGTTGSGNTSDVKISASVGNIQLGSIPVLPTFLKGALPAVAAGGMIYVSDATGASLTGSMCFSNGAVWIDVTTGAAVA